MVNLKNENKKVRLRLIREESQKKANWKHWIIPKNISIILYECLQIHIQMPLFLAKISANFFQLFPKPLLTNDQLKILKYDNIASGKYQTNFDIGVSSSKVFDKEVEKYCYMWRLGGQFSTKKYTEFFLRICQNSGRPNTLIGCHLSYSKYKVLCLTVLKREFQCRHIHKYHH